MNNVTARPGQTATFKCQVDMSCIVSYIEWYHEMDNGTEKLIKVSTFFPPSFDRLCLQIPICRCPSSSSDLGSRVVKAVQTVSAVKEAKAGDAEPLTDVADFEVSPKEELPEPEVRPS